jgi:hypothetical protein
LLLEVLSPAQKTEFQRYGYFAVEVAERGRFLILPSTLFNVLHVATGRSYCAVPRGEAPLADLMLAQKLLLEHDPDQFFRVADCLLTECCRRGGGRLPRASDGQKFR